MLPMSVIVTGVGYFVFSAAVGAMAAPSEAQKTRFYGWLYRFLQRLAANADRLAEARFGGLVPAAEDGQQLAVSTPEHDSVSVVTSNSGPK